MQNPIHLSYWIAVLLCAVPACAIAGGQATIVTTSKGFAAGGHRYGAGATRMHLVWRDGDNLRLQNDGESDYMLVHHGKAYSVSRSDGGTRVMAMAGMMQMMHAMGRKGAKQANHNAFGRIGTVEPTGRHETVAGIDGRVYRITWTDAAGRKQSADAVLTDNPLAVQMSRVYFGSMRAMFGSDKAPAFMDELPVGQRGVLRFGDEYRIGSIQRAEPPASTFELPAKPMDMRRLMRGMGAR